MAALLFSRFVYKVTHCEKVPSTFFCFLCSANSSIKCTVQTTHLFLTHQESSMSLNNFLMIEISAFKNASYRCLNAFSRCKIIRCLWISLVSVDSKCVRSALLTHRALFPQWPLYCLTTLTLGSQAGCWGVGSESPPGCSRGSSQWVWVSAARAVFCWGNSTQRCNAALPHSILCWEGFTHRNSVIGLGPRWRLSRWETPTIVLCPETAAGCLITCWVGWGAYEVYQYSFFLIINIYVVMCWKSQTLIFHPDASCKLRLCFLRAYRKFFFLFCLLDVILCVWCLLLLLLLLLESFLWLWHCWTACIWLDVDKIIFKHCWCVRIYYLEPKDEKK